MYLKRIIFSMMMVTTILSCDSDDDSNNNNDDANNASTFSTLSEFINFDYVDTDKLSFDPTQMTVVEGSKGTKITIPANAVKANGNTPLPSELFVLIREYASINDMVKSNVQTVSNGNVLVTGGSFWWDIIDDNGNSYTLNSNVNVQAEQPIIIDMGSYFNESEYFRGDVTDVDGDEIINWNQSDSNGEVSYPQNDNGVLSFYIYNLDLGWANCDAFYYYTQDRVDIKVKLVANVNMNAQESQVIFIPKDFPSVIMSYTVANDHFVIYNIPEGIEGTLIGISLDENDKFLLGHKAINVTKNEIVNIDMTYATQDDFEDLVDTLTN